jgi:hypothetical protein
MENQHRKIKGYPELSADEIALMNEVKELGPKLEAIIRKVEDRIALQRSNLDTFGDSPEQRMEEALRINAATPERWVAIAKTHYQQGLMALTRAVAQPDFF